MERSYRLAVLCSVLLIALAGCSESEGNEPPPCEDEVCGGSCVDTDSDEAHCGGCGNACPTGQACTDGVCCPAGQELCNGACTDLTLRESCGACGVGCGAGEDCVQGAAGWSCVACGSGESICGESCVDTQTDGANCGTCGNACPSHLVCSGGSCVPDCDDDESACGGSCVDTQSHADHCGACGNVCPGNQLCSDGTCGCQSNETQCGDDCVDPQRNRNHCGGCGNACAQGFACIDGSCLLDCERNETICDDRCADLNTDPLNCGSCGFECAVGAICSGGGCECPSPTSLCDGVCVDTFGDVRNCGGCGNVCGVGERCVDGACSLLCREGETMCGDKCANLTDHPAHCGGCFVECDPGFACIDSVCTEAPLPDLSVDTNVLANSIDIVTQTFDPSDCAIVEGCVFGGGDRRLMRFSARTPNLGLADLNVGVPAGNPHLVWSPCHGHYHFEAYASYRLLDMDGNVAAQGHKQAFCLMDINRVDENAPRTEPHYQCSNQGISQGWADTYGRGLDCQWVDITGVPAGTYTLEVAVNPERVFAEMSYADNVGTITVDVPHDPNACTPSAEVCFNGIDEDCTGIADDGCAPITTNDSCANAYPIPAAGAVIPSVVGTATVDDVASSCGGAGGRDVIYRLDLAQEQLVYLSTFGSEVATSLSIRSGSCTGAETACANDSCSTQQEQWVGVLPAGTHYVVVEAHGVTANAVVQLKAQVAGCTGAGALTSGVTVNGDTTGGTSTRLACENGGAGPEASWYFTTCPGDWDVTATTCGTSWDTLITLTSGTCSGTAIACADDDPFCTASTRATTVSDTLSGDGLWWAIVDGYRNFNQGPYELNVTWAPAVP